MSFLQPIQNFYERFERPISSGFLVGGFIIDIFTLRRVDALFENLWIFGHLLIVGCLIILINIEENKKKGDDVSHKHFWYVNGLQFFFGGIFSASLVFYFRSSDIFAAWPFLLLIFIAFIGNEFLKKQYVRLSFQVGLYFLSIYLFTIFILPVYIHRIGDMIFLLSGILSLLFMYGYVHFLFKISKDRLKKSKNLIITIILGIFAFMNLLYFTNLIPPIPLSLKDAGVYHKIERNLDGDYTVYYEDHGWREHFAVYDDFTLAPGAQVYAFSAIFSPEDLNTTIIHEWQYFNEEETRWVKESSIPLSVQGGRDKGFRTYSARGGLRPGRWRVVIRSKDGQSMGHISFNIVPSLYKPELKTKIK